MSDRQCKNCEYADRNWEICDIAEDRDEECYCNKPLDFLLDQIEAAKQQIAVLNKEDENKAEIIVYLQGVIKDLREQAEGK